jgi:hypothetical protein
MGRMSRIAIVAAGALLAVLAPLAVYFAVPRLGGHVDSNLLVLVAGALAFGASTAALLLIALHRPGAARPYQRTRLNEMPVTQKISLFADADKLSITARPEQSAGEILVRFGDTFKSPPEQVEKKFVVTLKGSKKAAFNPVVLRQLFATLAPFKLEHVILQDGETFVGYIPGKRAAADFTGTNAETKITDCIIKVLANPSDTKALKAMNGATMNDIVADTDNIRQAVIKFNADDTVQELVVHRHLKPFGVITKSDLLTLASTEAILAGL